VVPRLTAVEAYNGAFFMSINLCAMFVRRAIERSHKKITRRKLNLIQQRCAFDYGISLLHSGFKEVQEPLEIGDIAIYQVTSSSPYGHIQIFTGTSWVSDFRQPSKFPDETYVEAVPVYYRFYGTKKTELND
jgi:hypothetical protein